jgi:outer membrane lipoprotein LolB
VSTPVLLSLRSLSLGAIALLLSACAQRPVQPVYTNIALPQYWEAEGKAALRTENRGGNIYFTWTQQGPDYHIIVRGPLGLGRAELTGNPGHVTLVADNIEKVSAGSLEELLEITTKRRAPISHALHWLTAEPGSPGAVVTRDTEGRPLQIIEDGWTIDYLEWSEEAPRLPRKLTIAGPDGRATVVIGLWRLHLSAENP